jgi:uncharacterized protein (DUF305 family)
VSRSRRIAVAVAAVVLGAGLLGGVVAGGSGGSGSGDGGDDGRGASDGARTVQPGAPGEGARELTDDEAAALGSPEHTPADTAFVQGMIEHHRQALTMAALVDGRSARDDIPLLAERITVAQEGEIELLEQWLTDRGEEVPAEAAPGEAHDGHAPMPGMATAEQLAGLEAAQGAAFDRLFLVLMIAHHQGALTMVDELYAAGGGLEPAADGFARGIEADQSIEIVRMQELLAAVA